MSSYRYLPGFAFAFLILSAVAPAPIAFAQFIDLDHPGDIAAPPTRAPHASPNAISDARPRSSVPPTDQGDPSAAGPNREQTIAAIKSIYETQIERNAPHSRSRCASGEQLRDSYMSWHPTTFILESTNDEISFVERGTLKKGSDYFSRGEGTYEYRMAFNPADIEHFEPEGKSLSVDCAGNRNCITIEQKSEGNFCSSDPQRRFDDTYVPCRVDRDWRRTDDRIRSTPVSSRHQMCDESTVARIVNALRHLRNFHRPSPGAPF
jgi:hypothetical protein